MFKRKIDLIKRRNELKKILSERGFSEEDIREALTEKGYYPKDNSEETINNNVEPKPTEELPEPPKLNTDVKTNDVFRLCNICKIGNSHYISIPATIIKEYLLKTNDRLEMLKQGNYLNIKLIKNKPTDFISENNQENKEE
jgi:antitoxin component of MazEF toxin-antitoxin module